MYFCSMDRDPFDMYAATTLFPGPCPASSLAILKHGLKLGRAWDRGYAAVYVLTCTVPSQERMLSMGSSSSTADTDL